MFRFYLAHPFESREAIRAWELQIEQKHEVELFNPFYDIARREIDDIDSGRRGRYEIDPPTIVHRDFANLAASDGVLAIIDGAISYGAIMEMVYANMLGLKVYAIITNAHEKHPWLVYHSAGIWTSMEGFEMDLAVLLEAIS